ncbi:hypothetical protein DMH12_38555, partial [Streptomyces sp. WAC 04229]|uniref:IS701 family transposase n=1 Tax=Streptomyces sp. WAC 04229 TaxID=2203206 RepID=UPI0010006F01
SQVGVFLAYATSRGRALIDRRLYLPERSWCTDPERRRAAGMPEEVRFATKPRLAREMIAAALHAEVQARWVTGDEAYGHHPQLRASLEARATGYVLAVACSTRARINKGRTPRPRGHRRRTAARHRLAAAQRRQRCERPAPLRLGLDPHRHRRPPPPAHPPNRTTGELAFYLCWSPTAVSLADVVHVAGIRWSVEERFQAAKSRSDSTTTNSATGPHGTATSRSPYSHWSS